jgi:hypothetical protein
MNFMVFLRVVKMGFGRGQGNRQGKFVLKLLWSGLTAKTLQDVL